MDTNQVLHVRRYEGGPQLDTKYLRGDSRKLRVGNIIERILQTGDKVIFNRQPTLHKGSMMVHTVIALKSDNDGNSISFNPMVCSPYNADYDGDEMNVHIIQDPVAYAESAELMGVSRQILSSKNGGNAFNMIQDSLLALYLMTKGDVYISHKMFYRIINKSNYLDETGIKHELARVHYIMTLERKDLISKFKLKMAAYKKDKNRKLKKKLKFLKFRIISLKNLYSGRVLFSLLLPPDFNYFQHTDTDITDPIVEIKCGVMLRGRLCKKSMGKGTTTIIKYIASGYDHLYAIRVLSDIHRIALAWNANRGFSIGWEDFQISDGQPVMDAIAKAKLLAKKIEREMVSSSTALREAHITAALNGVTGNLVLEGDREKGLLAMIVSGSKGTKVNVIQIKHLLGQQNLSGRRPAELLGDRASIYAQPYDIRPEARGFISQNLRNGMEPMGFIFHMMAGREGLTDTSARTPQSGYLNRQLSHALTNYRIESDGTVRNLNSGRILQYVYGTDGRSPESINKIRGGTSFIDISRETKKLESQLQLEGLFD